MSVARPLVRDLWEVGLVTYSARARLENGCGRKSRLLENINPIRPESLRWAEHAHRRDVYRYHGITWPRGTLPHLSRTEIRWVAPVSTTHHFLECHNRKVIPHMNAPNTFAQWMSMHKHRDPKFGHVYNYHSRSDAHSVMLCELILKDLVDACPVLASQGAEGKIAYGINARYLWPTSNKLKALDLVVGQPLEKPILLGGTITRAEEFADVYISCEAKAVMTEHK